ncbi:LLM class flavin-dependent oxidoreductase [Roseomonas terrae]|jgi:alkanesulfonate monooxygenase|uniref:LLM class flavin-dependent oxidoreductase n=1 Tax=Neoroseomonas terrae TaxID=424799 RepID=A0ABS5EAZ9_9PROT|nr:LLM class flavin-dependent oxidoreductase [Neoroseomonas terrae]MBR0648193.1 LLM class flavin-dependent oxidoreductase [Neoroseomonas terrae]
MTDAPPRFGIWALVHGSRAARQDPEEPFDASWSRNRALILEAEALGFDSTLVAQHTFNPYDPTKGQLEAWTASAALAGITSRIEIITAIKPLLYNPVVLAKMALQIEEISGGRFAINLVNAWNRAEMDKSGLPFPEHDDRYTLGDEWLSVVEPLLRGERVDHRGPHFQVQEAVIVPRASTRARPRIYIGGESEPARALAAARGDVWFINGQPIEDVAALIADVARRPRSGAPLRYGLSAFVIARATEDEALAAYERLATLAELDKPVLARQAIHIDPATVMHRTMAKSPRLGTNGGTAAGLVGTYDQVAERIAAFHQTGIETFMLQFQPFEAEMRRFAAEVMPRVRSRLGSG